MKFRTAIFLLSLFQVKLSCALPVTQTPTPELTSDTVTGVDNLTGSEIPEDIGTGITAELTIATLTTEETTLAVTARTEIHIGRVVLHKISDQLEEKLASLSCDLPLLPRESRLWKGNETHEILLPLRISSDCANVNVTTLNPLPLSELGIPCQPTILSWEVDTEIQSGDVLLVRIDDSHLVNQGTIINKTNVREGNNERMPELPTAVYQVTRMGHDNCDITEGVLLDITPLKVDNRKVVTLYDKDLAEGINLLIVVSELWGNQCVRLKVVVKSDNCGENEECSGKGVCYSNFSMEGYECQCCPGFIGPHCEEQNACYLSPCKNNGICVDISEGHEGSNFQCLCPYGYTGRTCEEETDPCTSMPCQNGATCTGNVTQFRCECAKGFNGLLCQHSVNECDTLPCIHGICADQEDGYKCFCQPGFIGTYCEYEYNECQSSPCLNGGLCTDHIDGFSCTCGRGYTGQKCHIKVNLCDPNPCFYPRYCNDKGNYYSCDCPRGYSGTECSTPSRAACSTNPCSNGGTCWSSMDSFYCACRPGYTGKTCDDEFVLERIKNLDSYDPDDELNLDMSTPYHPDRLHKLIIAAGTLASAVFSVAFIVTVCHCRVHKTYKRFTWKSRNAYKGRRAAQPPTAAPANSEWFSGKDKAPMATPSRSLPSLDTADMYYTLDFSDSQSSPLIQ